MDLDADRRRELKEIYFQAVELCAEELDDFLKNSCRSDAMREEIRTLIAAERRNEPTWLERPAMRQLNLETCEPETEHDPKETAEKHPYKNWSRYTDLELLASGGMGDVYRAFDPRLKRLVALKFIRAPDSRHIERFMREAESQARVAHENVLEVFETGEVEGKLYIAMRFVDGPTLIGTRSETSLEEKVRIMWQVAEAIHAAHREGLVHRDIKPSNILIHKTHDGPLKPFVTDFGIAMDTQSPGLTATGDLVGTPWYMAPERLGFLSRTVDRRTDIYSLGVTMFEYLCGERPYPAEKVLEMLAMFADEQPRSLREIAPEIPVDLETIVMKCLEHEPDRRYASARDLADDLRHYLDGEPINAQPPSLTYRLANRLRRYKAVVSISLAAIILLLGLGISNISARHDARERENLAREFGRRVEQIDKLVQMAKLAPAHGLDAETESVEGLMDEIRDRLKQSGDLGEGSGSYALGRAYLALGKHPKARENLMRALTNGYEAPEVTTSLGRVLGELYLQELRKVERIENNEQRKMKIQRIETELKRPALEYLVKGGGAREASPEYIAALIAFLNSDYDLALDHARAGQERLAWAWEAHTLEGDILHQRGSSKLRKGNSESAKADWDQALSSYGAAAEVARSDEAIFIRICDLAHALVDLELELGSERSQDYFDTGLQACETALVINPGKEEAFRLKSNLYCTRAEAAMRTGENPRQSLENASRAANSSGKDVFAFIALGNSWLAEARYELSKEQNCLKSVNSAIEAYENAKTRDSRSSDAHRKMGDAQLLLARAIQMTGEDPKPALATAILNLERAAEISPTDVHPFHMLGEAHCRRASFEVGKGRDPKPDLIEAMQAYQHTVDINPDYAPGHLGIAKCYQGRMSGGTHSNEDFRPNARLALDSYQRAIDADPSLAGAYAGTAEIHLMIAQLGLEDSDDSIASGLEAAATALDLDHDNTEAKEAQKQLRRLRRSSR